MSVEKLFFYDLNVDKMQCTRECVDVERETEKIYFLKSEPNHSRTCSQRIKKDAIGILDTSWGWHFFMVSETVDDCAFVEKCLMHLESEKEHIKHQLEKKENEIKLLKAKLMEE